MGHFLQAYQQALETASISPCGLQGLDPKDHTGDRLIAYQQLVDGSFGKSRKLYLKRQGHRFHKGDLID